MNLDDPSQRTDLVRSEPPTIRQRDRLDPELGEAIVPGYVDVSRLSDILADEEEAIRPMAEDGRHPPD